MPSKRQLDKALRLMRLYGGSLDSCSIADQQRLYLRLKSAMKPLETVAKDAWEQVGDKARALGYLRPVPGRDI